MKNAKRPWTPEDDRMLLALAADDIPTWRMSDMLQRPEASVLKRLSILEGLRARDGHPSSG